MTTRPSISPDLVARHIALAAKIGSKATTHRGAIRALLACPRGRRPSLLAPVPHRTHRGPVDPATAALKAALGRASRFRGDTRTVTPDLVRSAEHAALVTAAEIGLTAGLLHGLAAETYVTRLPTYGVRVETHVGYAAGEAHRKAVTAWRHGRPYTESRAEHHVTVRAVGVAKGASLAYEIAGQSGTARAPEGARWAWVAGQIGLRRGREFRPVRGADIAAGLYDRPSVWMPADLAAEFGPVEFGSTLAAAKVEIARKRELVADRARAARASDRDRRAARLLSRLLSAPVRVSDATAIGHCMPGITAWAEARGLDVGGSIPCRVLARDSDDRAQRVAVAVAARVWARHVRSAGPSVAA